MRTVFVVLFLLAATIIYAQKECATQSYTEMMESSESMIEKKLKQSEIFFQQKNVQNTSAQYKLSSDFIIRIPVVVHVLYYLDSYNIPEAQIKGQIEALNRDFRRLNADTVNTPERFKALAADIKIEFVLATADPKGRPTSGIIRKKTGVKYWNFDDKIKFTSSGGDDAWDSRYYLNIWLGDMRSWLGYSSVMGGPADKDGIVINTTVFNASGDNSLGRTATHEIGHWLGLKHIWGDTYCGDDGVADTPSQSGFTADCPTTFKSSCNNGEMGDMYMNYMDLTNDGCMNLFTKGQRDLMRSFFEEGRQRHSLLLSKGLQQPWVEETTLPVEEQKVTATFTLYPNPVSNEVILNFGDDMSWIGKELKLMNMNGVLVQKIIITSAKHSVFTQKLAAGIYFIQGENNTKKIFSKLVKL